MCRGRGDVWTQSPLSEAACVAPLAHARKLLLRCISSLLVFILTLPRRPRCSD